MDEMNDLVYNSTVNYFNSLSRFGYVSYGSVTKLLALIALDDMLSMFEQFVTESDLKSISNATYCLSGTTCLIAFPKFYNQDTLFHETALGYIPRVTEDNIIRSSQNDYIRIEA